MGWTSIKTTGYGRANVAFYAGHAESLTGPQLRNNTATHLKYVYARNWQSIGLP
ncbi:MAG: hypothetical protein WC789_08135 [Lentisphaeria bacterium]|jgi:hypothetical protein